LIPVGRAVNALPHHIHKYASLSQLRIRFIEPHQIHHLTPAQNRPKKPTRKRTFAALNWVQSSLESPLGPELPRNPTRAFRCSLLFGLHQSVAACGRSWEAGKEKD
jgi:hypothetical protein